MNTKLRLELEKAIDTVLNENAEDELWTGYIHDEMVPQMAEAAAAVFDSAMSVQEWLKEQGYTTA